MVRSVKELEVELVALSESWTAPRGSECLFCYGYRMLTSHGCDCTLRWAARWRDQRAPRATALERRLGSRGGYCDCEIFLNGWTASAAIARWDPETEDEIWPDPMPACPGVRPKSTQPSPFWRRTARPSPRSRTGSTSSTSSSTRPRAHEQITITKNGAAAAVLVGIDEWESLQETLFWLSQPGILEPIAEAKADVEAGRVYSEEQIRAEFNVPKR